MEYLGESKIINSIQPLISVCVQTYQHSKYIKECLDGILKQQTDFPYEVIIGEDESADGTREVCIEYAEKFPDKIRLFLRNREDVIYIDGNPTGRFNFINNLRASRGKYIALCEGDDYWTDPLKLQKQIDFLEENPEFVISFHDTKVINQSGELIKEGRVKNLRNIRESSELVGGAHLPTCTVLFRNIIEAYPASFKTVQNGDTFLWAILGQHGKGYFHRDIKNSVYRKHSGGVWSHTNNVKRLQASYHSYYSIYKFIDPQYKKLVLKKILGRAVKLSKAHFPSNLKNTVYWSMIFLKHLAKYSKISF